MNQAMESDSGQSARGLSTLLASVLATGSTESDHEAKQQEQKKQSLRARQGYTWSRFIDGRGKRYEPCRLSTFETLTRAHESAIDKLTEYSKCSIDRINAGVNLIFFGPAGSGKDHLLTAMVFEAIGRGHLVEGSTLRMFPDVDWRSGPTLFSELRSAISSKRSEADVLNPLISADVLALSDICQAGVQLTDYQQQILYLVLDSRYSRKRPTWLTINAASREELDTMLGVQLADRFIDGALTIACNWPSFRKTIAQREATR